MLASHSGHASIVDKLSKGGRMPKIEDKDPHGFQALMVAALQGHASVCSALLDKKAEVNARSEDGETSLMMASAEGHTDVVKLLLETGADPDALDKQGMGAIKKAAKWGRVECLKELLPKVEKDPRQLKHCLLFGRLCGHPDIVHEMTKALEPEPDPEEEEENQ